MSTNLDTVTPENDHLDIESTATTVFDFDYTAARDQLLRLYDKGTRRQWIGSDRLDWSLDVDLDNPIGMPDEVNPLFGSPWWEKMDDRERGNVRRHFEAWRFSQFMHGEQGALLCTAKIVETVPWIDAKYYAATQVMDEARHVEVFSKYLDEKLSGHYPMNAHLGLLLDDIVADSRWDMTYLGMQIMVEGLALAAFGFIHMMTTEPLLKKLLRYVMADEARHVAFGVLSLQEYYKQLSAPELRERQEFAFEAAIRMKDRMAMQEVWERMEVPTADVVKIMRAAPEQDDFQILLFSKIVPNLKKLGLLDAADGWLRTKFTEMGAIAFEHLSDSTEEEDAFADGSPAERQVV